MDTRLLPADPGALRRTRVVARLKDDAARLPFVGTRVGIDPLLSVIPGGTAIGALLSIYVVAEIAAYGVPPRLLARMVLHVVVDLLVGAVPFVGPAFDAVYRADERNVRLFARYVARQREREGFVAIEIE